MKTEHTARICELVIRLIDAVESIGRHTDASNLEFVLLHNLRYDALALLTESSEA